MALLLPFITVVYVISYFLQLNFLSSINMWDQVCLSQLVTTGDRNPI